MAKQTLAQLERHLSSAADLLPRKMEASERKDIIFGMLFLKRCSDEFQPARQAAYQRYLDSHGDADEATEYVESSIPYRNLIFVPPAARWWLGPHREQTTDGIRVHKGINQLTATDPVAASLDEALLALESGPNATILGHVLRHIRFTRQTGQTRLHARELVDLIGHFDRYSLRDEDFEFPGMLGEAFESLIRTFAEAAGTGGAEFYTPRSIVRMMVRLVDPESRDRVYDPCAGSAGMLLLAKEHVEEHAGDATRLALFGQEISGTTWAMARMNLLLHGVRGADLRNGDTLTEPLHRQPNGQLMKFNKVLCNPSFSRTYDVATVCEFVPDRMRLGAPEKADLMFVQHMVHVLTDYGIAATVMPHGVLFRGGEEQKIRAKLLEADVIEAVIGLGPNLFHGSGVPACVLVLRRPGGKTDPQRLDRVLFINAEREYTTTRAQNVLGPEHAEKIVRTFQDWLEIPGFSRAVAVKDLLAEDANLNIRRYVDSAPPPEPQDVSAHLDGGMPKAELAAHRDAFAAFGIDAKRLFVESQPLDPDYCEFPDNDVTQVGERIIGMAAARVEDMRAGYRQWWDEHSRLIAELPTSQRLMKLREALLDSFTAALAPLEVLDTFIVAGVVAGWWMDNRHDLKALAVGGFDRVLDGWVDTVEALDHPVVPRLLPDYLGELDTAEAAYADADAAYQTAKAAFDGADDADPDRRTTKADVDRARKARTDAGTRRNKLRAQFKQQLRAAADIAMASGAAGIVVLSVFDENLAARLDRHVIAARDQLVEIYRRWSDKYRVSLATMEAEREAATRKLDDYIVELGYRRSTR